MVLRIIPSALGATWVMPNISLMADFILKILLSQVWPLTFLLYKCPMPFRVLKTTFNSFNFEAFYSFQQKNVYKLDTFVVPGAVFGNHCTIRKIWPRFDCVLNKYWSENFFIFPKKSFKKINLNRSTISWEFFFTKIWKKKLFFHFKYLNSTI